MIVINNRFRVIDGWIVDSNKKEVVSQKYALGILTADEKRELAKIKGLKVFKNFDTSKNVVIDSFCKELFDYVKTENVAFVTLGDRTVKKNSSAHKRAKKSVVREELYSCHPVKLGARNMGYLHLVVPQETTGAEDALFKPPNKTKSKDNSVFTKIVKVQEFHFTHDDFELFDSLVRKNNSERKQMAGEMMKILKNMASSKAIGYFGRNYHGKDTNFIKNLIPSTLEQYGSRISFTLLVLEHCDKLSTFTSHSSTAESVAATLRECHTPSEKAKAIGKMVSGLSDGSGDTEFWMILVFLGAFDFSSWQNYSDKRPPSVPMVKYRYFLDSMMWLFKYGGVLYCPDKEVAIGRWTAVEASGIDFVGNIKKLYYNVGHEAQTIKDTDVQVNSWEKSVEVKHKKLSFPIIGAALRDITAEFDKNIKKLTERFMFADFIGLHFDTIGDYNRSFDSDHSNNTIFDSFSKDELMARTLRWRNPSDKDNAFVVNEVRKIIANLNRQIMVMVWMSTGMPMRFPELSTLSFSGISRNLYIDTSRRRLYLNVKYNKNGKFTNRILFMTDGVSRRLWWTISLLRLFVLITFPRDIKNYNRSAFIDDLAQQVTADIDDNEKILQDEDSIDENISAGTACFNKFSEEVDPVSNPAQDNTLNDAGFAVMGIFLFVDFKSGTLFKLKDLNNELKCYPTNANGEKTHSISSWRQAVAALWKYFIIGNVNVKFDQRVAAGFGHSTQTLKNRYGSDDRFSDGGEFTFMAMSTATDLFHEAIGHPAQEIPLIPKQFEMSDFPMDSFELLDAGKRYFDTVTFDYKSKEQMAFTTMVMASDNRKIVGLQAPTAFGKSLTFILPMMVLKKCSRYHYVSFVCVPYEALKVATITKLERGGLIARDVGALLSGDDQSLVPSVDVFVGCLETFKSANVHSLFHSWERRHAPYSKLGYLVFDEAHTLFLETEFRPDIKYIKNLSWAKWKKTLFLSATMNEIMYNRIVHDRAIPDDIKATSLYVNFIDKLPSVDVETCVEDYDEREITKEAAKLVQNFLNNTINSKAVFFFSSKIRLHNVYKLVGASGAVGMVDGDSTDTDKRKIFHDFEDEYSDTRVVMGTKLLSNGLDCKTVQFVCLVDCAINCVDYLQMVGRIRSWGYVKIIHNNSTKQFGAFTEINNMFPSIDWNKCISQTVAKFYDVPFVDHDGCCGDKKRDAKIEELRKLIHTDTKEGVINLRNSALPDSTEIDGNSRDLASRVYKMLWRKGSSTLMSNWKYILGLTSYVMLKDLLLDVDPRDIVLWDDNIPSYLCEECLMRVHPEVTCSREGKTIGNLVYEYLAVQRILHSKDAYIKIKQNVWRFGASLTILRILKSGKAMLEVDFLEIHTEITKDPKYAEDRIPPLVNPMEKFKKFVGFIARRNINVLVLLFTGQVEHNASLYSDMTYYYSSVFNDRVSIDKIATFDSNAIFAIYKQQILRNVEVWFKGNITDRHEEYVEEVLGELKFIPVLVTMIWALFESRKYKVVLNVEVGLDRFEYADTFPVFFKYMCAEVFYHNDRVPLYSILLGHLLGNMSSLERDFQYVEYSRTEEERL